MIDVAEALRSPGALGSDLQAGVEAISSNQIVRFVKYERRVLPIDGFVFWIKASLLPPTAGAEIIDAKGSLHYATDSRQDESETYSINRVQFTSEQEIQDLSAVSPTTLYIGEIDDVRFAFSSRGSFYFQAALWHYVGNAIYSDMVTQVIDDLDDFSELQIVSNSLPIWLSLNGYAPFYGVANPTTLYPSYLLPSNLAPPYASVHIDGTRAIGSAPRLSRTLSHTQLAQERVLVTTYGLNNNLSQDLLDCVLQYSIDHDIIGMMNQPIVRDEKRTQSELGTIAQKKTIEFEVNYYQSRARNVARQLILSAVPNFIISGL